MYDYLTMMVAEGEGGSFLSNTTHATLEPIFDAGSEMLTFAGQVLNVVVSNPVLVVPLAVSFTYMAINLFKALKRK